MRRQDKEETWRDPERAHQVGGQPQSSQLPHTVLGWLGLLLSSAAGLEGETLHLTHCTPHTLHSTIIYTTQHEPAGTCCHGDGYHSDGYCGNGHHGDHYHSNVHESTTSEWFAQLLLCCLHLPEAKSGEEILQHITANHVTCT